MGTVSYLTIDDEIISETRTGTEADYVPASLGSTIALLNSSQTITDFWTYWPYGEVQTRTGTNATPMQFGGTKGYHSDSNSKSYNKARILRKDQTRWLTVDPLWPDEEAYCYVGNNPITLIDPFGLGACSGQNSSPPPDPLDEPFTKKMCRALCDSIYKPAEGSRIGPIIQKSRNLCYAACERLGSKGLRRAWCKGIEATIDHILRHPGESTKAINNKQLLENLLALWNAMGCPGEPPSID